MKQTGAQKVIALLLLSLLVSCGSGAKKAEDAETLFLALMYKTHGIARQEIDMGRSDSVLWDGYDACSNLDVAFEDGITPELAREAIATAVPEIADMNLALYRNATNTLCPRHKDMWDE